MQNSKQSLSWTIFLLCLSYALDYYNLTIFSISYRDIAQSVFGLTDTGEIEKMRISVNNWQNLGVVLGSFIFGPLGDKWGRVSVLKFSIFIYSVATFLGIFTDNLTIFTALRFICGVGLACEFSISSVLITELAPAKRANWYSTMLYASGIAGGLLASVLGFSSWKLLFYIGSLGGLAILLLRSQLRESKIFLNFSKTQSQNKSGQFRLLLKPKNLILTLKFFSLNIGFHLLISYIFLYPSHMPIELSPKIAVKMLLMYFFIGGIIGTAIAGYYVNRKKKYTPYLIASSLISIPICAVFPWINQSLFAPYCLILGMIAGGYPVASIQLVTRSYGANIRSTASNVIFGLGRSTNVLINIVLASLLSYSGLSLIMIWSAVVVFSICTLIMLKTKDTYASSVDYLEVD